MFVRSLITLLLISVSGIASAQKLDISLSQETARASYTSLVGGTTFGRTELTSGLLFNEDDNVVADVGLQVIDMAGTKSPGLEIGVGPRFYYATVDELDAKGAAIALGGNLRYKMADLNRASIYSSLYYAPGITAFMDAENMMEFDIKLAYEVLPTADAYIGYRKIRMKLDTGDESGNETVDSGAFIGMRFEF